MYKRTAVFSSCRARYESPRGCRHIVAMVVRDAVAVSAVGSMYVLDLNTMFNCDSSQYNHAHAE